MTNNSGCTFGNVCEGPNVRILNDFPLTNLYLWYQLHWQILDGVKILEVSSRMSAWNESSKQKEGKKIIIITKLKPNESSSYLL